MGMLELFFQVSVDAAEKSAPPSGLLASAVVAAVVSGGFLLVSIFLKDIYAIRALERWRQRSAQSAAYERYRWPIILAAKELGFRCHERVKEAESADAIHEEEDEEEEAGDEEEDADEEIEDPISADPSVIQDRLPERELTAAEDDHFSRYKLLSDAYRLCCFLGWLELYRRELGAFDRGQKRQILCLDRCLKAAKEDISLGGLIYHRDWRKWTDSLIFEHEQRAIGHRMIASSASPPAMIDYGEFCEILERDPNGENEAMWFFCAVRFFANLSRKKDFRIERLKRLHVHLVDLRLTVARNLVLDTHINEAVEARNQLLAANRPPIRAMPKYHRMGSELSLPKAPADLVSDA